MNQAKREPDERELSGYARVGSVDDFRPGKAEKRISGSLEIAVIRWEQEMFAVDNHCPHQHFSALHNGEIRECSVICPMHGHRFDLRTGKSLTGD
ncbi:MAG: Rieske 2Fe-2S domain-containing protein, partial [Bacteroidota bacterium]